MLKINKQTITLTKGDDASLRLVPRYKDKTEYVLTEGDSAVFRIKFGHTLVELDCTLNLETNKIVANITPNDTKDFNPGIYRYEAELITSFGFHYTFIADQTFILGQEYEQRITSTSNGNGTTNGNLPEIDGVVDGEPVVYGDIQPTNPMMDYEELNHLPKLNGKTIKGDKDNEYYGIPTKTSDLENDSDFVSDDEYVHTDNNYDDTAKNAVDALGTASTYDVPESGNAGTSQVVKGDDTRLTDSRNPNPHTHSKADITDFPTNVSAFNNDSGFITNTVNNLANYYLKTQTYTQTEVDNLISAAVSGRFQKVNTLPASGQPNVIYLVPKADPETSNTCDEYIWQDNAWELIGSTEVDLSDYVTDDDLTTALQSYLTTSAFNTAIASYYTKTETDNLLANKVDKVAGKGLSTNDYDNTAKSIVDGVTSALNDKVDKVQGKGLSTNDYDNTAKGIVDGVTSALADKVDKVNGKGLSTEDYTTAEKSKLGDISDNAKKVASSSTNGHIEIDDVDTTVYDDTAVQNAIENIEDELSTDYATVEGNPINFTTKSAQNAKSTILSLAPIQDLHGFDKPWVGGAGKNLLPMTVTNLKSLNISGTWNGNVYTLDNVTFSILTDSDGNVTGIKINSNGTLGSTLSLDILNNADLSLYVGKKLTCHNVTTTNKSVTVQYFTGASLTSYHILDIQEDYTIENIGDNIRLFVRLQNGQTVSNETFQPMLRLATVTDSTFEPYSNICPISGRTEIGILGCGKNLFEMTPDNVSLGQNYTMVGQEDVYTLTSTGGYSRLGFYINGLKIGSRYTVSMNIQKTATSGAKTILAYTWGEVGWTNYQYLYIVGTTTTSAQDISLEITAQDTKMFIGFYLTTNNGSGDVIVVKNAMLRLASDADSNFEPYTKSNDLTISLGQTVYGGTLDVENGVLVVDKGYAVFDGSDSSQWSYSNKYGSALRFDYAGTENIALPRSIPISNMFYVGTIGTADLECINIHGTFGTFLLQINENRLSSSDVSGLMTWFSNNNMQVCYELATPITINLTPHTINLLKGVNNISTDGDKITLTYRDGSVATLGDLTSAVNNLDSKIDESKILTDTVTGDKYILVVTNGVLSVEQISN